MSKVTNSHRICALVKESIRWVETVLSEPLIQICPIVDCGGRSAVFRIKCIDRDYILMVRFERSVPTLDSPTVRNEREIKNEIAALNASQEVAPRLVAYSVELAAMLFEALPKSSMKLSDALLSQSEAQCERALQFALEDLDFIHRATPSRAEFHPLDSEWVYGYVEAYARTINSNAQLPRLIHRKTLLHGNPNPRNRWLLSDLTGKWLDFEDAHFGAPEFDFGYLLGHLRVLRGNRIIGIMENALRRIGLQLDLDVAVKTSKVVLLYLVATEPEFHRYPSIDYVHVIEEAL